MSNFVPLAPSCVLSIDGTDYAVTDLVVQYAVDALPVAQCRLAAGTAVGGNGRAAPSTSFPRWAPAKVTLKLPKGLQNKEGEQLVKAGETILFSGIVDSDGPSSMAFGQYGVQVILSGAIKSLDSGTLQTDRFKPRTWLDTTQVVPLTVNLARVAGSARQVKLTKLSGGEDLWAGPNGLKTYLLEIANTGGSGGTLSAQTNSALAELSNLLSSMPASPNKVAADALATITGACKLLTANGTGGLETAMSSYILSSMANNRYRSFWATIVELGQQLGWRVVSSPYGQSVVPFSTFAIAEGAHKEIKASSVLSVQRVIRDPVTYAGVIFIRAFDEAKPAPTHLRYVSGKWLNPNDKGARGLMLTEPAPPFLYKNDPAMILVGAGGNNPSDTPVQDAYARMHGLEINYRARGMTLRCPLRTDLGLHTPVKFTPPSLAGQPVGTPVYGTVQALSFNLSAESQTAETTVEIGYLRSEDQFKTESKSGVSHPFFSNPYPGARFDAAPA